MSMFFFYAKKVYGHLLPGYTTEEMLKTKETEKLSIRKELNSLKTQGKATMKTTKNKNEPEL